MSVRTLIDVRKKRKKKSYPRLYPRAVAGDKKKKFEIRRRYVVLSFASQYYTYSRRVIYLPPPLWLYSNNSYNVVGASKRLGGNKYRIIWQKKNSCGKSREKLVGSLNGVVHTSSAISCVPVSVTCGLLPRAHDSSSVWLIWMGVCVLDRYHEIVLLAAQR